MLTTHVKYAPFASQKRRGYVRDANEKDLSVHLETALRGVIIGNRWPKSGVEVIITVLEGEEDHWWGRAASQGSSNTGEWGMMNVLSGCITVASAAIVDAGIDCVDMASGGVAAIVEGPRMDGKQSSAQLVLDPVPSEHRKILAACYVAYLPAREEITDIWVKGDLSKNTSSQTLMDNAVQAALATHHVLALSLKDSAEVKVKQTS